MSASNEKTKGIVPNNEFSKSTFKLNASRYLAKTLKVSGSVNYMNTQGDRIQQGSNVSGVMLGLLRTPPTFDNSYGWKMPDGTQRTYRNGSGYDNPYWISNEILYHDNVNRIIGMMEADWNITDYLKLTYRAGIDWYSRYASNDFAIYSNDRRDGYSSSYNGFSRDFNQDIFLNLNKDLGEKFNLNVTLGNNLFGKYSQSSSAEANGLIIPDFYNVANTADNKGYESTYEYRTYALFADVGVSFANQLFLNATGRYEKSTTLPDGNNGFFYPSVSLGWIFTELGPLKDNSFLTFGKLRASYAITANIPGAYRTNTYFYQSGAGDGWTAGVSFPFKGTNGYTLGGTMGNPDLTPETTTDFEVGLNLNFFMNRVAVDVAYFNRKTEDILLYVPVAPSSGYGTKYMNAATMSTDGFEILVNVTPIKTRTFKWDITLNWSNPNSVVDELAPGVDNVFLGGFTEPQVRAVAGQTYRSIYGTDWLRDEQGQLIIEDDPNSVLYGHPMPDPETKLLGSVQPDWTMGLTNTFRFAGFTLTALLDIKHGGQMWNGTKGALYFFGAHKDTENREDDYTWPNGVMGHTDANGDIYHYDGNGNEIPGPGDVNTAVVKLDESWRWWDGYGSGFTGPSSPYIEDAGWVRLRELTFSYNFMKILHASWIQNLELYFTGRNLWLSTDYTGIDPETSLLGSSNAQGFDYFNMPGTKSYIFGLKIGF
jgi:outer membrane receptor protein involved in Fe transport